jgi:hypothetical protein
MLQRGPMKIIMIHKLVISPSSGKEDTKGSALFGLPIDLKPWFESGSAFKSWSPDNGNNKFQKSICFNNLLRRIKLCKI